MTSQALIGYFGALFVVVPAGALIAKVVAGWIAGFRPSYIRALISTGVAYVGVNVLATALFLAGAIDQLPRSLFFLLGWAVLAACHFYLLRSREGERLTIVKAAAVSLCQYIGAIVALSGVLVLIVALKRVLT